MNQLVVTELTRAERRNLRNLMTNIKKEKENNPKKVQNQKVIEESNKALIENKEKRIICYEQNKQRKITNNVFEQRMKEYERVGYELELKITIAEKEIAQENFYLKRINCFLLILGFLDGIEKMVVTDSNGEKRRLSQQDMFAIFLMLLLEEEEKTLEMNHRIMQLYMLLNGIKEYPLENEHPFYLSEEDKIKTYSKILEIEAKRKEVEKQETKNNSIDFSSFIVNDFLGESIETIYTHVFESTQERKMCK